MRKIFRLDNKAGETLEQFIKGGESLLTALAVLVALTAFVQDLKPKGLTDVLVFLIIGAIVLIWLEIWEKLPEHQEWKLFLFRYFLLFGIAGIIIYWLYEYRLFWNIFLFIPYTIIAYYIIKNTALDVIGSSKITRKWFGLEVENKSKFQKWMIFFGFSIAIILAVYFGTYFSIGTNLTLDIIKQILPQP